MTQAVTSYPKIKGMDLLVLILTGMCFFVPIISDLIIQGWDKVFSFFAADTFYYLTVGRNFAATGLYTFDGTYITNGFHPLWQVFLGYFYKLMIFFSASDQIILIMVFFISALFILGSLILFARAFYNSNGKITPWLMLIPVGVYALLLAPFEPRFGSLWSYSNAMETPPVFFFFALFMFLWTRPGFMASRLSAIEAGLVLTLVTFSRLDHVFLVLAFFIFMSFKYFCDIRRNSNMLKNLTISGIVILVSLGAYFIANTLTTGMIMPVSGSVKTTFPHISAGAVKIEEISATIKQFGEPDFGVTIWRYTQIILPVLFAAAISIYYAALVRKSRLTRLEEFWIVTAGMVMMLGLYNFLFVPTLDQGHWYFPISVTFISLATFDILGKKDSNKYKWMLLAIFVLSDLAFYFGIYHNASRNQRFAEFYQNSGEIREFYATPPRIVEYDDGIITYSTGFPAMSGFGFCLDKEAAEAMNDGHLLDLAYERGYRHLASFYYFGSKFSWQSTPGEIRKQLEGMAYFIGQHQLQDYDFSVDYISSDGNFSIIRFDKK